MEVINFVFAKCVELIMVNTLKQEDSLLQCHFIGACTAFLFSVQMSNHRLNDGRLMI